MIDVDGKYLEVQHLQLILRELPKSTRVRVNQVGNLTLSNDYGEYFGYIDFLEGKLNLEEI